MEYKNRTNHDFGRDDYGGITERYTGTAEETVRTYKSNIELCLGVVKRNPTGTNIESAIQFISETTKKTLYTLQKIGTDEEATEVKKYASEALKKLKVE